MTIAQAQQRLLDMLPPGSRVELAHHVTYEAGGARRFDRWHFTFWMPGLRYIRSVGYGGGSLAGATRNAERSLAQYLRDRRRRERKAFAGLPPVSVQGVAYRVVASPFREFVGGREQAFVVDAERREIRLHRNVPRTAAGLLDVVRVAREYAEAAAKQPQQAA